MGIRGFLSFLLLASSLALSPSVFAQAPKPGVKPVLEGNTEKTATQEKLIYKIIPALKPDVEEGEGNKLPDTRLEVAKCTQSKSNEQLNKETSLKTNGLIYKSIFDAQSRGEFKAADKAIQKLTDCRVMGHVLLQRYLYPDSPRIGFSDLKNRFRAPLPHVGFLQGRGKK